MQMWYRAGVVGGCGWRANDDDRVAEHAYAADRCAREIGGFLKARRGARAAADRQAVGPNGQGRCCECRSGGCRGACLVARLVQPGGTGLAWSIHAWSLGCFTRAAHASSGSRMPGRSAVAGSRQCAKLATSPSATTAVRPNPPLELTPLCGREIVPFLKAGSTRPWFRSIGAAQLSGNPLGGYQA